MKKKKQEEESILATLKFKIIAIAGLIAAITILITNTTSLINASKKIFESIQNQLKDNKRYKIETKSISVLPYYLNNFLDSNDSLYWFKVRLENRTPENLHMNISFKITKGPATVSDKPPTTFTIKPNDTLIRTVDPGFEFTKDDLDSDLVISWIIRDSKDNILKQGITEKIHVLPKSTIDWDLTTPDGNPVPKEFLLASLTAWSITGFKEKEKSEIYKISRKLNQNIIPVTDSFSLADQWLKECYNELFQDPQKLKIIVTPNAFPMKGRQRIKLPSKVIEEGHAYLLEAALLIGALGKHVEELIKQIVLFIVPETENHKQDQSFYIALLNNGKDPQAFNLNLSNEMSFEENKKESTLSITELLKGQPEIIEDINDRGVFIDEAESIFVLDFFKAEEHYYIRGLP